MLLIIGDSLFFNLSNSTYCSSVYENGSVFTTGGYSAIYQVSEKKVEIYPSAKYITVIFHRTPLYNINIKYNSL